MRRPTAATLIMAFLAAVREAHTVRIVRYMASEPLSTPSGTTRNGISGLTRAGQLVRVGRGRYAIGGG